MRLHRFVLLHLLSLAVLLALVNGYAIHRLYHWGLDDSSEFYLWRDAEQAMARYAAEGRLPPGDDFLGYYANLEALPASYRQALERQGWQAEQVQLLELPGENVYALPFILESGRPPAWVLHRFRAADDEGYTGLSLSELAFLLLLAALPPLALVAWGLIRAFALPLQRLSAWAETLPGQASPEAPEALRLAEFDALAKRLQGAFTEIGRQNEHEQRFLQTLSHELRTPLAVSQAALEVLARQHDSLAGNTPLARIARANKTMSALAESLLWLWREGGQAPEQQELALTSTLHTLWEELASSGLTEGFALRCSVPNSLRVTLPPALLRIVLGNLLRNALNYGAPGTIEVSYAQNRLVFANALADTPAQETGFGLGLYLVRRIAERQGWRLQVEKTAARFALSLELPG